MTDFGYALKGHRMVMGWRQRDLVDALGGQIARSTLANVEAGRERPSPRLWELLSQHLPAWTDELQPLYETARQPAGGRRTSKPARTSVQAAADALPGRGGPFKVELLQLAYVFRQSRSPEEILETRRVCATRDGVDRYGLKMSHTDATGFRVDEEPLWGGHLEDQIHHDAAHKTVYVRNFVFDHRLRKGQRHEFALRSWVDRDPEPGTEVMFTMTIPCHVVAIHLNFRGPHVPKECWDFGPLLDEAPGPHRC